MARLLICSTCTAADPDRFAEALAAAISAAGLAAAIGVERSDCMGACASPIAIALQGQGLASYVFAGLQGTGDIADVIATCRVYLDSPGGEIADARRCGRLRHLLRARLPPLT